MERIEREIAAGRVAIPVVMYRRPLQTQTPSTSTSCRYLDDDEDDEDDNDNDEDDDDQKSSTPSSISADDQPSENSSVYSQSSEAEWESSIDANGELIYIDCHPKSGKKSDPEYNFQRTKSRRSTRGKILRLIRRRETRESKRKLKKADNKKPITNFNELLPSGNSNKVTFRDCQEGEEREVSLLVDPKNRIKFGRQMTISEAVLGLNISSFSDNVRIMVAGIVPDSEAAKHRNIKIGDWLKSINDREVTTKNVTSVLERIKNPCITRLKLQRIAGVEVTTAPPPNQIPTQSQFVRQLINPSVEDDHEIAEILIKLSTVSILFLTTEGISETGPEFQGVIYCYPPPIHENVFCKSRGVFLTLQHLLPDIVKSNTISTSILVHDDPNKLSHIIYTTEGSEILLLALPDNRCTLQEAIALNKDLVKSLTFMYQTLNLCFTTKAHSSQLDHFFARFFARVLSSGFDINASQSVEIHELASKAQNQASAVFEETIRMVPSIPLPRDVQLDVDDALSAMEACDYRAWNEDPMDCQRLFTVIGSCVYHAGFLLASHFQPIDLLDIHSFCRQQGLLHLFRTESLRSFVLWREVFPASLNRGKIDSNLPKGRWFLLIVGHDQDMLAVIFEAGGCTVPVEEHPPPDPFYVEEVQYALEDIQSMGVTDIARKWVESNIHPQVIAGFANKNSPAIRQSSSRNSFGKKINNSDSATSSKTSPFSRKPPEVTSILKRRGSANDVSQTSVSMALQYQEDSSIFTYNSEEVSDESRSFRSINSDEVTPPVVMGRREARELGMPIGDDSESEFDWNNSRGGSPSGSSFDLSDIRQLLLSEIDNLPPYKITGGRSNALFHYVKLDMTEGVLLCPGGDHLHNPKYDIVLNNFKRCSQIIHNLFKRTIRFKNLLNHNNTERPIINKSLVAIKEHGVLFEYIPSDSDGSKKVKNPIKYWVVGRLFLEPRHHELYICYEDSTPQNLVEIAFRLGILEAG